MSANFCKQDVPPCSVAAEVAQHPVRGISSHCTQWLLTHAEWAEVRGRDWPTLTPTNLDHLGFFYGDVLHTLGQKLKVRQQVIATAVVYFRRFFVKVPWYSFDPFLIVLTVMYLAIKTEESGPIMIKHVLAAADKIWAQLRPMLSIKYDAAAVKECEFFILEELEYSLVVYHPYRPLVGYAGEAEVAKTLLPIAWNIANDSLRTDLALLYPPHMVAIACLQMASKIHDVDITIWYAALQVNDTEIMEISAMLTESYTIFKEYNATKDIPPLLAKIKAKSDEMDSAAAAAAAASAEAAALEQTEATNTAAAEVTARASVASDAARASAQALSGHSAAAAVVATYAGESDGDALTRTMSDAGAAAATCSGGGIPRANTGGGGGGRAGGGVGDSRTPVKAVTARSSSAHSSSKSGGGRGVVGEIGGGGAGGSYDRGEGGGPATPTLTAAAAEIAGSTVETTQIPGHVAVAGVVTCTADSEVAGYGPDAQHGYVHPPAQGYNAYTAGYTAALSYIGAASALGMPP